MKKRLVNVSYTFKTGDKEYTESQVVSVKVESGATDKSEAAERLAVETVGKWFRSEYPESECSRITGRVILEATLYAIITGAIQEREEDSYSAEMSLDRIDQLIGEMKTYTDRVVLNGWAPTETIEYFAGRPGHARYYVNTFEDPDNHDRYTVIKWG